MSYLLVSDYNLAIQPTELAQITTSDPTITVAALSLAQAVVTNRLSARYDMARIFKDIQTYSVASQYYVQDRITDGINLYYASYPVGYPLFDSGNVYSVGDKVFYKNKLYTCLVATNVLSHGDIIQRNRIESVPDLNVYPDDLTQGVVYWGPGLSYVIPVGTSLSNTAYFTLGDTRNPELVEKIVDIALWKIHKRISPRNVPELRQGNYEAAMAWMDEAVHRTINIQLPLLQPIQGRMIRFGGKVTNETNY